MSKHKQENGGNGGGAVAWVCDVNGNKLFPMAIPGVFGPVSTVPTAKAEKPAAAPKAKCKEGDHHTRTILRAEVGERGANLTLRVRCACGVEGDLLFPADEAEVMCETCDWED